jgi:hypothetical protein
LARAEVGATTSRNDFARFAVVVRRSHIKISL